MKEYFVSVYVNGFWKFINVCKAASAQNAIDLIKHTQPLYANNQWKAELR